MFAMKANSPFAKTYTKTCLICKKSFSYYVYVSTEKKQPRQTCSKECRYILASQKEKKRIKRVCKNCQQTYSTMPCHNKSFCSRDCYNDFLRKRTGDKNPAWKPISESSSYRSLKMTLRKHLIKSDTICEDCQTQADVLEIHHKDKNRDNNKPNNLVILCKPCHAERHRGERAYNLILKSKNYKFQQRRSRKKCEQCGELFILYKQNLRFCSRQCSGLFKKERRETA
jgi:hypothetical protein